MSDLPLIDARLKRGHLIGDVLRAKTCLREQKEKLDAFIQRTRFRPDGCLGEEPVQLDKGDAYSMAVLACLVYEAETRLRFAQRLLEAHKETHPSLSGV